MNNIRFKYISFKIDNPRTLIISLELEKKTLNPCELLRSRNERPVPLPNLTSETDY